MSRNGLNCIPVDIHIQQKNYSKMITSINLELITHLESQQTCQSQQALKE